MIDNNEDRKIRKVESLLMKLTPEKEEISSRQVDDAWRDLCRSKSKFQLAKTKSSITNWIVAMLGILILSILCFGLWFSCVEYNEPFSEVCIKSNQSGQNSLFRLPEESSVFLNSIQSKVHLEGEILFNIKDGEKRVFLVVINDLKTTGLEAQFNVYKHSNNDSISATLIIASLEVSEGMIPRFKTTKKIRETRIQTYLFNEDQIDWSDWIHFLEHVNFYQVIEKLELWYGVQVEGMLGVISSKWNFHGKFKIRPLYYVLE